MRRHPLLPLALLAMLAGLASVGCSRSLGSDGPDISISGHLDRSVLEPPTLHVEIGRRETIFHLHELGSRPVMSREIHGPRYGDVPIHVALVAGNGTPLAAVEFVQEFERGSNHWVTAVVGLHRPGGHCIGTLEVAPLPANAFPETTGGPDTLFVMHGSIPKGAIC